MAGPTGGDALPNPIALMRHGYFDDDVFVTEGKPAWIPVPAAAA
jgi:hypothetical protein